MSRSAGLNRTMGRSQKTAPEARVLSQRPHSTRRSRSSLPRPSPMIEAKARLAPRSAWRLVTQWGS